MGNTIERCEVVNDLNGGGVKAVRLTDGRYVTEKLARELEEEIQGERKKLIEAFGPMNGEQVIAIKDFARHFYELGKQSGGGFEIPADLEKAADEMALRAFPEKKSYSTVIDRVVDYNARDRENYRDGIIAGAKWQKEQKPVRWKKDEEALLGGLLHKTGLSPDERFFLENLRPSWKPSKTQIMALEQWLKNHRFDGAARYIYPIFESLFNGLKTL